MQSRKKKVQDVKSQASGEMEDQVVFLSAASERRVKTQTSIFSDSSLKG